MLNEPFNFNWNDNIRARVNAANSNGESIWSDESQGCRFAVRPPCARILGHGGATETTLDFTFAPGISNIQGFDEIEGDTLYRIRMRTFGDQQWRVISDAIPFITTEFTASDLAYGEIYEF